MDLSSPDSSDMIELLLVGINNVMAMDQDYTTDFVLWADIDKDEVFLQKLLKLKTRKTSLADSVPVPQC